MRTHRGIRRLVVGLAMSLVPTISQGAFAMSASYPTIPSGRDSDLKLYDPQGHVVSGSAALAHMDRAGLVAWVAGNQFFAMDDVVHGFQRQHPGVTVGLLTLPPGLLKSAILADGWRYEGKAYPGRPDVYATVGLEYLQDLKRAHLADRNAVYMHNELQLMVARGNPKHIEGLADLARADVRTSMPNPLNEGIMRFYGRPLLERHGLWQAISGGQECVECQSTPNNWFTAVHHRETPERISQGLSDAGLVWKTEVMRAVKAGMNVEGVPLSRADSMRDEVAYGIAPLVGDAHAERSQAFLAFLASTKGQEAYARHGFVPATPEELVLKPIP